MAGDDEHGEEEWSPEDDKIEHKFLKKLMKKMDREEQKDLERERASKEAREKLTRLQERVPRPPPFYGYSKSPWGPQIRIRPIENGFVISYAEILQPPKGPESPEASLEFVAPGEVIGPYVSMKYVDVFVRDATEAVSVLSRAFDEIRKVFKMNDPGAA